MQGVKGFGAPLLRIALTPERRIIEEAVTPCLTSVSEFMRLFRTTSTHSTTVVSVGGSLIVPDAISTDFLLAFRATILKLVAQGYTFSIISGGGKTARRYQAAAEAVRGDLDSEDVDWLGIHATRLNAHLLRALFKEEAQARISKNPERTTRGKHAITIGAGWRPGFSTDYCAVMAGKRLGAKRIVNLSDIDYVCDSDPDENPHAKKLPRLSWDAYRAMVPADWSPGLSAPFDPIAAKAAQELHMEVAIINGSKLGELENYLTGKDFIGSIIR